LVSLNTAWEASCNSLLKQLVALSSRMRKLWS